ATALNTNGVLEVFARKADGSLQHIFEQPGTSTGWSSWGSLGGNLAGSPAAITWSSDGHVEVFARGVDNALWHVWQNTAHGSWHAFASLGGSFASDPAIAPNADGRPQVFIRGGDGGVRSTWWQASGGWATFASLGAFAFPGNPR